MTIITEEMDEQFCICGHKIAHHSHDDIFDDIPEEFDWLHEWTCHYGEKSRTETREDGVFVVVAEIMCQCTAPASLLKSGLVDDICEDGRRWHNYV